MAYEFRTPIDMTDKEYSQVLDEKYGFQIHKVEENLCKEHKVADIGYKLGGSRTWIGLHPQIFQTPYSEIDSFLKILKSYSPKILVDLGAGYGRVGLVMQKHIPEASFLGLELVKERCLEGNRIFKELGYKNCVLKSENIVAAKYDIPKSDIYFIYDFSDQHDQKKLLDVFSKRMETERFFMVVRGKSMRSLIQNKYPEFYSCFNPRHEKNWSIYSTWCDLSDK